MNSQEQFWSGKFGNEYIERNKTQSLADSNLVFFTDILPKAKYVRSALEIGCNIGLNLESIHTIDPAIELTGIDINAMAIAQAEKLEFATIHETSIFNFWPEEKFDLVFTKGVLIHIHPDDLNNIYHRMYELSNKYIMVAEYYNPKPVELTYRGNSGKLFKRDFAGEMIDLFNLELVDYGFAYHRGKYPQDDISWFLLRKRG